MSRIAILSLFLIISTAYIPQGLWRGDGGVINFESDAPLELIQASSDALRGVIDPAENTFAFALETKTFKGFNSALQQEHFHENYIESEKYPKATFAGKFIEEVSALQEGSHDVRAKGMLTIHGQSVERIIKCRLEVKTNEIVVTGNFTVPLTDHHITIPQVVHQKIAEEIYVEVAITLKPV